MDAKNINIILPGEPLCRSCRLQRDRGGPELSNDSLRFDHVAQLWEKSDSVGDSDYTPWNDPIWSIKSDIC